MSKFIEQTKIDRLINNMTSSYTRVIVEKNCGYQFIVFLNNDALLSDLYREVELVYGYMNIPLNLYYGKNYLRNNTTSNETVVNNETKTNITKNNKSKMNHNISKRCNKCKENEQYNSGEKVFIPKNNSKFRDYVNEINLGPCTNLPEKVCYRVYLDICEKH